MKNRITMAATILGLVLGSVMISTVCWTYAMHQQFGVGGAVLTVFGAILVGLSVWRTIDVSISPKGGVKAKFEQRFDRLEKSVQQVANQVKEVETHVLSNISALAGVPPKRLARLRQRETADFLRHQGCYDQALDIDPQDVLAMMGFIQEKTQEEDFAAAAGMFPRMKAANQSGVAYSQYPTAMLAFERLGRIEQALSTLAELDAALSQHVQQGFGYLSRAEQLSWIKGKLTSAKEHLQDSAVSRAVDTLIEKVEATILDLRPRRPEPRESTEEAEQPPERDK
jgi:hypothetical protein